MRGCSIKCKTIRKRNRNKWERFKKKKMKKCKKLKLKIRWWSSCYWAARDMKGCLIKCKKIRKINRNNWEVLKKNYRMKGDKDRKSSKISRQNQWKITLLNMLGIKTWINIGLFMIHKVKNAFINYIQAVHLQADRNHVKYAIEQELILEEM